MKPFLLRAYSFLTLVCITAVFPAVRAAANPPPRLTVELRDGSRVVGTSVEKSFKFHSTLLGNIKLGVKDIRSVECVSSNSAKLTTTQGDNITVSFVDSSFAVMTSFGKLQLAAKSVRKFNVSTGGPSGRMREGLVLFWSGNGDGKDNFGTDPDTAADLSQPGLVKVSNNAALVSMEETRQLGFEAWIKPNSIPFEFPVLLGKGGNEPGGAYGGYEFCLNANGGNDLFLVSGACMILIPQVNDSLINNHIGEWIHVAFTLDDQTKTAKFYVNGQPTIVQTVGFDRAINFNTSNDLYIGAPDPASNANRSRFDGEMRNVMLFNRALTAAEVREDYAARSND